MVHEEDGSSGAMDIMAQDRAGLMGTKEELHRHVREFSEWIGSLPEGMLDYSYAPQKWTIRTLLGHIIDSHIVILYRILSISRGDQNPLPGGNQDLWASFPGYAKAGKEDLVKGYGKAAGLSEWLADWIPEKSMESTGIANGMKVSVRDLYAYLIAHERHHQRIAMEKYGVSL